MSGKYNTSAKTYVRSDRRKKEQPKKEPEQPKQQHEADRVAMPEGFPEQYKQLFLEADDATRISYIEQFCIQEEDDHNAEQRGYLPTMEELMNYEN